MAYLTKYTLLITIHHTSMLNMVSIRAEYNIHSLALMCGKLPRRAHLLVVEWAYIHREELNENWNLAQHAERLKKIRPLY